MDLQLYAMTCGWLTMPMQTIIGGEDGSIKIPIPAYLIRHPKGTVLFDTGMSLKAQQDPAEFLGDASAFIQVHFANDEDIQSRLQLLDVDVGDIDMVINSHLHFDHAGGNAFIPDARILVQKDEWHAAHEPDFIESFAYQPEEYDLGQDIVLINGAHDLFGDGSVTLIPTPGHTPGHQSLLIKTKQRQILLAGDACYLRRTLEEMRLPAIVHDADQMLKSLQTLKKLEAKGAEIFYGHDPEFWSAVPQAPARVL